MAYRISALVSTYAAERYMGHCLDNLIGQTLYQRGEMEIVVIDSASPQNEQAIVADYQQQHPHIQYLRTARRETLYAAWNRAATLAKAPILINANTDDRYVPDALETFVHTMETDSDAGFCYGDAFLSTLDNQIIDEVRPTVYRAQDWVAPSLLLHHFPGHQIAWKKSLHHSIDGFNDSFKAAGDYDFFIRLSQISKGVHIHRALGYRLFHSGAITLRDQTMAHEHLQVLKNHREIETLLRLYHVHGLDTNRPVIRIACLLDLAFRALIFFPQWRAQAFDNDLRFAQQCVHWAQECIKQSRSSKGSLGQLSEWVAQTERSIQALTEFSDEPSLTFWRPQLQLPDVHAGAGQTKKDLYNTIFTTQSAQICGEIQFKNIRCDTQAYIHGNLGISEQWLHHQCETLRPGKHPIAIWGASERGRHWAKCMERIAPGSVSCFIDSDPMKTDQRHGGLPVHGLDALTSLPRSTRFILAAGPLHWPQIRARLNQDGHRAKQIVTPPLPLSA